MRRSLCTLAVRRILQSPITSCNARMVHLKSHPDYTEEKEDSKPLKFSTSKGSHRRWTVAQSFGSEYQQPWWKVLPLCLSLTAILIWAVFRKETEIDEKLYKPISELIGEIEKEKSNSGDK